MQPQGLGEHPGAPGHQYLVPSLSQLGNTLTIKTQQEIPLPHQKHRPLASHLRTATKTSHASAGPPGMTREAIHSMHTNSF